ncbi:hypothetical protein F2981_02395 [Sinorhizobium meliloti]|nr:hypothetical protein [Sinorhizobium meliloti]
MESFVVSLSVRPMDISSGVKITSIEASVACTINNEPINPGTADNGGNKHGRVGKPENGSFALNKYQ